METKTYTINGMSCQHCVMAVQKELEKLQGVQVQNVAIGVAKIELDMANVTDKTIREAIKGAGYEVTGTI